MTESGLFVGLMSGTSLDGIDAVLVRIEGTTEEDFSWKLEAFTTTAYDSGRRRMLLEGLEQGTAEVLCRLNVTIGAWLAAAVQELCQSASVATTSVTAIGSHGQTVWHVPPSGSGPGATLQLGDPATLAEQTGAPVVSDFRSRDVAAGGHGAPLVAGPDRLLFSSPKLSRALQNLGGMANVTWLPPSTSSEPLLAFDTGPGVALIDEAVRLATGGEQAFDVDGLWARRGTVDASLLGRLVQDPFFASAPPKSTGREHFGRGFVGRLTGGLTPGSDEQRWCDLIATLTMLTARTIGDAYRNWVFPRGVDEVYLMGGGTHNPALVQAIEDELGVPLKKGGDLGVDPDVREALAFAVLAWAHTHGVAGNVPSATGASGSRVLGSFTPGAGR
jgi:anhydro-N-acetylmuramic acid kinase